MARGRDFLERFRPVGTPGAAARRGVPVDHVADLTAELMPVLAQLDDTQTRCEQIRRSAQDRAAGLAEQARWTADAELARARAMAEQERAAAAACLVRAVDVEVESALDEGRREAARIREAAARRLPDMTEAVAERMLARLPDGLRTPP